MTIFQEKDGRKIYSKFTPNDILKTENTFYQNILLFMKPKIWNPIYFNLYFIVSLKKFQISLTKDEKEFQRSN